VQVIFFTFARTRGQSFTSLDCNKNKKLKVNKQTKTDRSKIQKIRLVLFFIRGITKLAALVCISYPLLIILIIFSFLRYFYF
jgi:hypothetical protein